MYMSEKTEKRLKIIVNSVLIVLLVFSGFVFWENSQHTDKEHQIEQGQLPVYLERTDVGSEEPIKGNASSGKTETIEPEKPMTKEEYMNTLDLKTYQEMEYDAIVKSCENKSEDKVFLEATVYSVLEIGSAITYSVADEGGNYYSIVDGTGFFGKFPKASVIEVYGVPRGTSKLNGSDIPSITAECVQQK